MKKILIVLGLIVSSFAQASFSCDIYLHSVDRLKLTDAEEAKIQLYLESINYNYNPSISYFNKSYDVSFSSLEISKEKTDNGETLFSVYNLEQPQKISSIEIPLRLNGAPIKILKGKSSLLGYFLDNGTPGFKLAMSVVRNLPRCNEESSIAISNLDRNHAKKIAELNNVGNFGGTFGIQNGISGYGH